MHAVIICAMHTIIYHNGVENSEVYRYLCFIKFIGSFR